MPSRSTLLWILFAVVCIAAAVKCVTDLSWVLSFEVRGAMDSDVPIYMIVGRALLRGLTLYTDIYESKPPGIFVLSALSLALTRDQTLLCVLSALIFASFPIGFAWFAWKEHAGASPWRRYAVAALSFALGTALALYIQEHAGMAQTEAFGIFFLFAYILVALRADPRHSRGMIALLSLLLLLSIGMKEPFVLIAYGVGLLLAKDWRHFVFTFVVPLGIAAVAGVLLLLISGLLIPYLTVQLPAMIGGRAAADGLETHLVKTFTVGRVYGNLTKYYTAPLFGYLVASIWVFYASWRSGDRRWTTLLLCAVESTAFVYFCMFVSVLLVVHNATTLGRAIPGLALGSLQWKAVGLFSLLVAACFLAHARRLLWHLLVGNLMLLIATATVGISIYTKNHFTFAAPLYAALLLLFIRSAAQAPVSSPVTILITVLTLLLSFSYQPNPDHITLLHERLRYTAAAQASTVARFEQLMERCGFLRYFGPIGYQELAFSRFVPLGPLPNPPFHGYLGADHPLWRKTHDTIAREGTIIIVAKGETLPDYLADLQPTYTNVAPACAEGLLPLHEKWDVWFRMTAEASSQGRN